MSTSIISEDFLPLPDASNNNNDASLNNQNLTAEVKAASLAKLAANDIIVHPYCRHDPKSGAETSPTASTPNHPKSPPPCTVPTPDQEVSSAHCPPSPVLSQSPLRDVLTYEYPTKASEPEVLPKSILKSKMGDDASISDYENKETDLAPYNDSIHSLEPVPLQKRSIKYSSESLPSSQSKRALDSTGSHTKIPVPVSTIKMSSRKKSRKNSITEMAGETRLSECIFEEIFNEAGKNVQNMSDGYINEIILQSSKKSIDRGLDSSGDFLDDSEDVFEEEEKRKEACDNIVMKFLELTTEKTSSKLSPATCVRSTSQGATPILNMKSTILEHDLDQQVGSTRSAIGNESLPGEQVVRILENKVSLDERRIGALEVAAEEKDLKSDQIWRDLKVQEGYLLANNKSDDMEDQTESNKMEIVVKSLENKLTLYVSKIENLEDQLKNAKTLAEDKDTECQELKREVNLLVSRPEVNLNEIEGTESSQFEHMVKGMENKLSLYENKIDSLEDKLRIAKSSVEDKDRTCDEVTRELKVTEAERNYLEVKAKDMDEEVNIKKVKISDLEEELRIIKSKYAQLEMEVDEETQKVESSENKRKDLDLQVNRYEIEVNSLKSKLEMGIDENDKLKDELKIKSEVINNKGSEIEERNRRMEVLEADIAKFDKAYQDANLRLIKSGQDNQEKEVETRDLETKVRELESEIKTFNQQAMKFEEKMKELEKDEFIKKRAMFEKTAEKVEFSCKKCENLEKKLKKMQNKIETTEEQLNIAMEKQDTLTEANNQLKFEIDQSLVKNENLIAEYKVKETDIIGKESEISGLKNKIFAMDENVLKLETKLKNATENIETLTTNSEESNRNLTVANATIANIEETVDKLKDENDNLKHANKLIESDFKDHTRLVQTTDSTLTKCEAALEALKKDFDVNRQDLKVALNDLNSLKASKQEIDMKYFKLVEDQGNTVAKLSEAETRAECSERSVAKLEQEYEKLVEELTNEKTKNQTVVQGFEEEVSQLMLL